MAINASIDIADDLLENSDINLVVTDKYRAYNLLFEIMYGFEFVTQLNIAWLIGTRASDEVITGIIMEYLAGHDIYPESFIVITEPIKNDINLKIYFEGELLVNFNMQDTGIIYANR